MRLLGFVLIFVLSGCAANSDSAVYESDVFFKSFETALTKKQSVPAVSLIDVPSDEFCIVKESDAKYKESFDSYLRHKDFKKLRKDQERFDLAYIIFSFKSNGKIVKYFTKNGTYVVVNGHPVGFLDADGNNPRYFEWCGPAQNVIFSLNNEKTFVMTALSGQNL